jgi:hypothetical protein
VKKLMAAVFACATACAAHAGVVNGSGYLVNGDIDWYGFTNTASGTVNISAVETTPDNSDFDSVLYLFRDDGNLTDDDFIAYDDDSGGGDSFLESWLSLVLNAGDYLLAVGTHGASLPLPIGGGHHGGTDYTLTISGDNVSGQVPEPVSLSLLGIALAAISMTRKKKV